jgi:ABC-type transport system involved in Fe-S cluster assembly fused permease/ATPase subunit
MENGQHFLFLQVANLNLTFTKRRKMTDYVKICESKRLMSFGNYQINTVQLFTNDWIQNNELKKGNKMYEKHKKNKEKEGKCLEQLKYAIRHSYK